MSYPGSLLSRLWAAARARTRTKRTTFDESAKPTEIPEVCSLTGLPLSLKRPNAKGGYGPRRPSIDRIDSSKGYVNGNVRIVSQWANIAKHTLKTDDELLGFASALVLKAAIDGRTLENAPLRLRYALRQLSRQPLRAGFLSL